MNRDILSHWTDIDMPPEHSLSNKKRHLQEEMGPKNDEKRAKLYRRGRLTANLQLESDTQLGKSEFGQCQLPTDWGSQLYKWFLENDSGESNDGSSSDSDVSMRTAFSEGAYLDKRSTIENAFEKTDKKLSPLKSPNLSTTTLSRGSSSSPTDIEMIFSSSEQSHFSKVTDVESLEGGPTAHSANAKDACLPSGSDGSKSHTNYLDASSKASHTLPYVIKEGAILRSANQLQHNWVTKEHVQQAHTQRDSRMLSKTNALMDESSPKESTEEKVLCPFYTNGTKCLKTCSDVRSNFSGDLSTKPAHLLSRRSIDTAQCWTIFDRSTQNITYLKSQGRRKAFL